MFPSCSLLLIITDTSSPWTSSPDNIPGQPVFPLPAGPFLTGSQLKHVSCFVLAPSCHCVVSLLSSSNPPVTGPLCSASRDMCSVLFPIQRPYPPSVYLSIVKSTVFSHHLIILYPTAVLASLPVVFWCRLSLLPRDQDTKFPQ